MDFSLIIPAFIAGLLTFLAPCTLPLVPAYLGFISGVSSDDLIDPVKAKRARLKIFLNGLFFVIGWSLVFIVLGTLIGFIGSALVPYRLWLSRIGGIFVIIFGLFMLNVLKIPFLARERQLKVWSPFARGNPANSLILGTAFGAGWTPCVGPILGSILLLASTSTTALQGALLLSVFSMGLAIPFLAIVASIALPIHHKGIVALAGGTIVVLSLSRLFWRFAYFFVFLPYVGEGELLLFRILLVVVGGVLVLQYFLNLERMSRYLRVIWPIGGVFLIFLGIFLLTGKMPFLISYGYRIFRFLEYERLLDYL